MLVSSFTTFHNVSSVLTLSATALTAQGSSVSSIALASSSSQVSGPPSLYPTSDAAAPSTGYYLLTEILTETESYFLTGSKTITYENDWGTPTATITGPFTSVETEVITTEKIAGYHSTTSYQPWDAGPYLNIFVQGINSTVSLDPSKAAAVSSFISYGREPACTSAYSAYIATAPTITETYPLGIETSTLANGRITDYIYYGTLTQQVGSGEQVCCWYCSLFYSNLQIRYWPTSDANTACLVSVTTSTFIHANTTSAAQQTPLAQNPDASEVYATGPDGFVYTSPSVYVAFPLISANDGCGTVGPAITSLTLAFAPGELSTVSGDNPGPVPGSTIAFNPAELPCGPDNGTNEFLPNPTNYNSYQPIVALPSKLLALRPDWAKCTNDLWEGQDPPSALIPASQVDSFSASPMPLTSADPVAQTTPAAPSSLVAALPSSTGLPTTSMKFTSPSSEPLPSVSIPLPSLSNAQNGDPSGDPTKSIFFWFTFKNSDQSVDPVTPFPSLQTSIPASSISEEPPAVIVAGQTVTANAAPISLQGNTIAYSSGQLYVGTDSDLVTIPAQAQQTQNPIIVGSFTFTPAELPATFTTTSSTGFLITPVASSLGVFVFHGQTIAQSDGVVTIDNIPIAVSEGSVYINGAATPLSVATAGVLQGFTSAKPTTIAGQTASILGPSAMLVNSQTITIDQPIMTVSDLSVAFGSPELVIESSLIQRPVPTSYVVIASETIALASYNIVIGGMTLTPGSPGITVNGTLISLGSSALVVGTKTEVFSPVSSLAVTTSAGIGAMIMSGLGAVGGTEIPLPTSTENSISSSITLFTGDAGRSIRTPSFWLSLIMASVSSVFGTSI